MTATPDTGVRPRAEVPEDRRWDAESVFATPADWESELAAVLESLGEIAAFEGRLAEDGVLGQALAARDALVRRVDRVAVYALMAYAVETTDAEAVARFGRAQAAAARVAAAISYVEPELLGIGRDELERRLGADPDLALYRHYVDDLFRRRPHLRSGEVEEALGLLVDPFSGPFTVHSLLADSDLRFAPAVSESGETAAVSQGSIEGLLAQPDRALRRSAWESYADGYLALRNALGGNLSSALKQAQFTARMRRHDSTLAAALSPANVPVEVFDNVVSTFERHLPTWHRYWEARRRRLGVDALAPWDEAAPLGGEPVQLSYEQCVEWVCASLAPLGDEYVETVRRACLEERWVDVYPNPGKMGGAFSAGAPGTRPFIVMSFDGTPRALGTLAHELGHSMHSYLAWSAQPQVYTQYSLFAAEVASNFHQAMLRAYLLDAVDDRAVQLGVLEEAFSNFHRYLFLMPTLARLEREAHELVGRGEGLTADVLCRRTAELFAEGYGPGAELDRERVGITWAQFGHLYEPFYVFQYATGISAAQALARGVLAGEEGAAERYLDFLRAGGSEYPIDALRRAGVDLASPEPIEQAFAMLESLVERLESLG